MFDFLKKKIKDFVGTISRKEEKAAAEETKESEKSARLEEEKQPIMENAAQMEEGNFTQAKPASHQSDSSLEEIATTKALEEI
ncbi:hypothetical protein HY989_00005, partial [Candidatus Micrarchaeota archaeon]|nr:hypothetical protein [Candidatus Micrarchaeota archaeon]